MNVTSCRLFFDWFRRVVRFEALVEKKYRVFGAVSNTLYYLYASRGRCTIQLWSPLFNNIIYEYILESKEIRDMVKRIIKTRSYFDSDTKPNDNNCKKIRKKNIR